MLEVLALNKRLTIFSHPSPQQTVRNWSSMQNEVSHHGGASREENATNSSNSISQSGKKIARIALLHDQYSRNPVTDKIRPPHLLETQF